MLQYEICLFRFFDLLIFFYLISILFFFFLKKKKTFGDCVYLFVCRFLRNLQRNYGGQHSKVIPGSSICPSNFGSTAFIPPLVIPVHVKQYIADVIAAPGIYGMYNRQTTCE
jgi:hypothetical protein